MSLQEASIKLLGNKDKQLLQTESTLTQVIEDDRLNINSFSHNELTNCSSYDFQGNLL